MTQRERRMSVPMERVAGARLAHVTRSCALFGGLLVGSYALGTAAQASESVPVAPGEVARAAFATEIRDREPVDPVSTLPSDASQVYFFTELVGLEGQTVRHRWEYQGETMAEVAFEVRGPRWRVYSSKQLLPEWSGDWVVRVIGQDGKELDQTKLAYGDPNARDDDHSLPAAPDDE